jgi:5'(3')-deoxyribonucleotidase
MESSLTILCDVDDVIAAFVPGLIRNYNNTLEENEQPMTLAKVNDWSLTACGFSKRVYSLFGADLYDNWVTPIPGALEVIRHIREVGHRVVFVSSCPEGTMDAKVRWLIKHEFMASGKKMPDFVAADDKSLIAGDMLVDDGMHNVEAFPGKAVLVDMPHNRSFNGHHMVPRIQSIRELPALLHLMS